MIFNIEDLVWLHLRKERFPNERKSKLLPRADGPFKVLARYNNNTYKIDLPHDKYNMSDIFHVKDLSPYHGDEEFDPRSDLSQGRGDDAEHPKIIPMDLPTSPMTPLGPMTRARTRAIEDKVNSLLSVLPLSTYEACMSTTSSGDPMRDQVLGSRPWNNYTQRTRRPGHQVQGTRRAAAWESPAVGRPTPTGRPTPKVPTSRTRPS